MKQRLTFAIVLLIVLQVRYCSCLASLSGRRVLVVGGSGRVGGSCVNRFVCLGAASITVAGTNDKRFTESQARWIRENPKKSDALRNVCFVKMDKATTSSVASLLQQQPFDLVVHTAGPFQGKVDATNGVLEASIEAGIPYIDVCDDYCTARAAKTKYDSLARQKKVPCIISTGCWPGVSSLMAKQLVHSMLRANPKLTAADLAVKFSFFTAGSGGAGVTLLVATFLILAEQALTIVNGGRRAVRPMTEYSTVDFGETIGERAVAHLNLLETASLHDTLGVGTTQSLFGTAPPIWNWLLGVMARSVPADILANEKLMRNLSIFSLPIVRAVDLLAGATNAMRVDVVASQLPLGAGQQQRMTAIFGHENLEPCVGECVAAFAAAVLRPNATPGVLFPEEAIPVGEDLNAVLNMASIGAHTISVEAENVDENGTFLSQGQMWGMPPQVLAPAD